MIGAVVASASRCRSASRIRMHPRNHRLRLVHGRVIRCQSPDAALLLHSDPRPWDEVSPQRTAGCAQMHRVSGCAPGSDRRPHPVAATSLPSYAEIMRQRHRIRRAAKWIGTILCLLFAAALALGIRLYWRVPSWMPLLAVLMPTLLLWYLDQRPPSRTSPGRLLRPNPKPRRTRS